ncbi:MAG: helix-turn-helix transcriptional regulator [Clostridia bacterium]
MDILSQFAERLKELMFDSKTTPELLSVELNHNIFDIYHWTSANNKYMPTVANLIQLANYFNCSIEYLLGMEDGNSLPNPKFELPKFSEWFPCVIKEKGFNLYQLGKVAKTSTTTYYRWINDVAVPSIDSLIKVSNALNCSIDHIIGRE